MLEARHVSVSFARHEAVRDVSLSVAPGEIAGIVGPNGSGKSTLGAVLSGRLTPEREGCEVSGEVSVDGGASGGEPGSVVASLLQNPVDQIVSAVVFDEVAFGPRNAGASEEEVARRVARALDLVGLADRAGEQTNRLSGGEQQRLALASCLALEPRYLVLDEPTAMLDGAARRSFRALVRRIAREHGAGVALITHDPLEALMCDRLVLLDRGRVEAECTPLGLLQGSRERLEGLLVGSYASLAAEAVAAGYDGSAGFEPGALVAWARAQGRGDVLAAALDRYGRTGASRPVGDAPDAAAGRLVARHLDVRAPSAPTGFRARRPAGSDLVLHDVSCDLRPGSCTLVAGVSGAGKTTLALALSGALRPDRSSVMLDGRPVRVGEVGLTFQNPYGQFFCGTVHDEIAYAARRRGLEPEEVERDVREACALVHLDEGLLQRDPFVLSGGEARRVAIAAQLMARPRAIILDEPTAGLDAPGRSDLFALVAELRRRGLVVIVISHDMDEWLDAADRVVLLGRGSVLWQGTVGALRADPDPLRRAGLLMPEAWYMERLLGRPAGGDPCAAARPARRPVRRPADVPGSRDEEASARRPVDVRVRVLLFLAGLAGTFALSAGWFLAAWAALVLGWSVHRMGWRQALRALKPAIVLMALVVIANGVVADGTGDVVVAGPLGLSAAGALRAAQAVARLGLAVLMATLLALSADAPAFADALVRFMRPLGRIGLPIEDVGQVVALTLRFMPMTAEEIRRIRCAQAVRGAPVERAPRLALIRSWLAVLVPALVGLMRTADRLAASMDARGYAAGAVHVAPPRPLGRRGWGALLAGIIAMACLVIASYR